MKWLDLRQDQFEEAIEKSKGVCVVPTGCVEMHGYHLPLGTDIIAPTEILERAAEKEEVCIFPGFPFGDNQGHQPYKGGIVFSVELMQMYLKEMCDEIARNGFKKILLYSGHGGNQSLLSNFIRSTLHDKKDYVVLLTMSSSFDPRQLVKILDEKGRSAIPEITDEDEKVLRDFVDAKKACGHACFAETALMMGLHPELVDMSKIHVLDGSHRNRTKHLTDAGIDKTGRFWVANHPDMYQGAAPDGCNERIGAAVVRLQTEEMAYRLKVLKEDTEALKINEEYNQSW